MTLHSELADTTIHFSNFAGLLKILKLFIFKGSQLNSVTSVIYDTRNKNIKKIIQLTFRYGYQAVILVHIIPAPCPLLYAITGYPSPDLWFTPYAIQNV